MATAAAAAAHQGRAKVRRLPWPVFTAVGLFSAQFKELRRQRYLWDAAAVVEPGVLTSRYGLEPTPWQEVLSTTLSGTASEDTAEGRS
jgi:hypothetical protein